MLRKNGVSVQEICVITVGLGADVESEVKTRSLSPSFFLFHINIDGLPRQARDKRKESLKQAALLPQTGTGPRVARPGAAWIAEQPYGRRYRRRQGERNSDYCPALRGWACRSNSI